MDTDIQGFLIGGIAGLLIGMFIMGIVMAGSCQLESNPTETKIECPSGKFEVEYFNQSGPNEIKTMKCL